MHCVTNDGIQHSCNVREWFRQFRRPSWSAHWSAPRSCSLAHGHPSHSTPLWTLYDPFAPIIIPEQTRDSRPKGISAWQRSKGKVTATSHCGRYRG